MVSGMIEVAGPSVCAGYWGDLQASRERFPDEWLCTGDRGWIDLQGFLWLDGRNEEFLKIRGRRVSFVEIEGRALQVDGVLEVAVLSTFDPEAGEVPVLFVVPESADIVDGLADEVLRALPVSWTCSHVKVLPSLPLTGRGKLDRNALSQLIEKV